MDREIKFRAWDRDNNCMIEDWYIITEEKFTKDRFLGRQAQTLATEIMQFTGLKDKNGKEIFEGDVVIDDVGDKLKVIFEHGSFWFSYNDIDMWTYEWNNRNNELTIEVIGNIYENSELLEEHKKDGI